MKFDAALIREQGQDFAVLAVKDHVINNPSERDDLIAFGEQEFGVRTALMGEPSHQTFGPPDIVRWLEDVPFEALPWQEFWFNN